MKLDMAVLCFNDVMTKCDKIKSFGLPLELVLAASDHHISLPALTKVALFSVNMFINKMPCKQI